MTITTSINNKGLINILNICILCQIGSFLGIIIPNTLLFKLNLYIIFYLTFRYLNISIKKSNKVIRCYVKHFQQPFMEQYGFDSSSEDDSDCIDFVDNHFINNLNDNNDINDDNNINNDNDMNDFNDRNLIINYYLDTYPIPKFIVNNKFITNIKNKLYNFKYNIIQSINKLNLNYNNQIYIISCTYCYKYLFY